MQLPPSFVEKMNAVLEANQAGQQALVAERWEEAWRCFQQQWQASEQLTAHAELLPEVRIQLGDGLPVNISVEWR